MPGRLRRGRVPPLDDFSSDDEYPAGIAHGDDDYDEEDALLRDQDEEDEGWETEDEDDAPFDHDGSDGGSSDPFTDNDDDGFLDEDGDDDGGTGRSAADGPGAARGARSKQIPELRSVMRRLIRVEELIASTATGTSAGSSNGEAPSPSVAELKETQFFLWSRFTRILADEHKSSSDMYSLTLNFHDRSAFEHLTHVIHRNQRFCEVLESATIAGGGAAVAPGAPPTVDPHCEAIGKLAHFSTCLICEGTREALLSPLGIADLLPLVLRESNRAKRLAPLSLIFSMFDQDEGSIGDAMASGLPKVLLQRTRATVGHLVDLSTVTAPLATLNRSGSPMMQAAPYRPALNPGSPVLAAPAPPSPQPMAQSTTSEPQLGASSSTGGTDVAHHHHHHHRRSHHRHPSTKRHREEAPDCDDGTRHRHPSLRQHDASHTEQPQSRHWMPVVGEFVGRGPGWRHRDQATRSDKGIVVGIVGTEVLVRWTVSPDHLPIVRLLNTAPGLGYDRIFRYRYIGPLAEVVPWHAFLRARTMQPAMVSAKLEELYLMGAVLGVLCNQKDCVLACFQYQTVECMLALVDERVLATHAAYRAALDAAVCSHPEYIGKLERMAVAVMEGTAASAAPPTAPSAQANEEAALNGGGPASTAALEAHPGQQPEEDLATFTRKLERRVVEDVVPFDTVLTDLEQQFRSQRELVARGLWVLNALLQHKKLALVFLERGGLERVLHIGRHTTVTTILYGCSLIVSQLARPAVMEEVLLRHTDQFTAMMSFAMHHVEHESADVRGSVAAFFFHSLSFPLVLLHFDANGGPTTAMRLLDQTVAANRSAFDVVNPTLCLVMLKGFATYLTAHILLQTRVLFGEHRSLSALLHRPATSALPIKDAATLEAIVTILNAPTDVASRHLPDVSADTMSRVISPQNLHAFRFLLESKFHLLILQSIAFYRDQDRFDLLVAALAVLKLFATFPFCRRAIVLCEVPTAATEDEGAATATVSPAQAAAPPPSGAATQLAEDAAVPPAAATRGPAPDNAAAPLQQTRGIPILLLVMEELNATNRESVASVVGALQVLLLLLTPPKEASDVESLRVYQRACAAVRTNDGIRVLLELLRPPREPTPIARTLLFPVVAHVVHILLRLVSVPGSDTPLLFRALGVHRQVKEVLQQYMDLTRVYGSAAKVVTQKHNVPINPSLSRFAEHAKCLVMGHLPMADAHPHAPTSDEHVLPPSQSQTAAVAGATGSSPTDANRLSGRSFHSDGHGGGGAHPPHQHGSENYHGAAERHGANSPQPPDASGHRRGTRDGGIGSPVSTSGSPFPRVSFADSNVSTAGGGALAVGGASGPQPVPHPERNLLVDPFELMERQAVVERSTLDFSRPSLLKLMASYLASEGLEETASVLRKEAHLPEEDNQRPSDNAPASLSRARSRSKSSPDRGGHGSPRWRKRTNEDDANDDEAAHDANTASTTPRSKPTLDGIVRSYLRFQHESSWNPIATLPPFDLSSNVNPNLYSKWTDVSRRSFAWHSMTNRCLARKESLRSWRQCRGFEANTFYGSHRHLFDVRGNDDELSALSVAFCDAGDTIVIGTSEGGIALFDTTNGVAASDAHGGMGDKLREQHVIFEDGGVMGVVVSPNQELIAAERDITMNGDATDSTSIVQLMRRDALPASILTIDQCKTVRFARHLEHLMVGTMYTASKCALYDLNRGSVVQVFTDSDLMYSATENFRNVAQLDATGNLVLSDATLWDRRCPTRPLFHFDRITENFSGQFHPNNRHVLIDKSVWDLRTQTMLLSCPALHQTTVHAMDDGSHLIAFLEPDYSHSSSSIAIVDGQTYDIVRVVDMKPAMKCFAVAPTGCLFAGIQDSETDVAVRIFSFGLEADDERIAAESEEPADEDDDIDDSDDSDDLELDGGSSLTSTDGSSSISDDGSSSMSEEEEEEEEDEEGAEDNGFGVDVMSPWGSDDGAASEGAMST